MGNGAGTVQSASARRGGDAGGSNGVAKRDDDGVGGEDSGDCGVREVGGGNGEGRRAGVWDAGSGLE